MSEVKSVPFVTPEEEVVQGLPMGPNVPPDYFAIASLQHEEEFPSGGDLALVPILLRGIGLVRLDAVLCASLRLAGNVGEKDFSVSSFQTDASPTVLSGFD